MDLKIDVGEVVVNEYWVESRVALGDLVSVELQFDGSRQAFFWTLLRAFFREALSTTQRALLNRGKGPCFEVKQCFLVEAYRVVTKMPLENVSKNKGWLEGAPTASLAELTRTGGGG